MGNALEASIVPCQSYTTPVNLLDTMNEVASTCKSQRACSATAQCCIRGPKSILKAKLHQPYLWLSGTRSNIFYSISPPVDEGSKNKRSLKMIKDDYCGTGKAQYHSDESTPT
jgi:hypothetical protein